MPTERSIVHIDLDTFFVSVERLKNPALMGLPVVIGGDSRRGVVASCSYEARKFGIHSAMPMAKALRLAPEIIVVKGSMKEYSHYSRIITQIIEDSVPLFEKASIDEFYIDLTGTDKFFGAFKMAQELRNTIIRQTGLPLSFGFSTSKTVSKIATGFAKPNGFLKVDAGMEKEFLAPLPISKIPMAGPKLTEKFKQAGMILIKDLQKTDKKYIETVFGQQALVVWEKAQGICHSQIKGSRERKSISTEHTYLEDVTDRVILKSYLSKSCEDLLLKLRSKHLLCSNITLKIRTPDFKTYTYQASFTPSHQDHVILKIVLKLFEKVYKNEAVRLIGIRISGFVNSTEQLDLFASKQEFEKLYQKIDSLKSKFGSDIIKKASDI